MCTAKPFLPVMCENPDTSRHFALALPLRTLCQTFPWGNHGGADSLRVLDLATLRIVSDEMVGALPVYLLKAGEEETRKAAAFSVVQWHPFLSFFVWWLPQ